MSYIGYPRLHFVGAFQSDVPTINNVESYFDNDIFEPRFHRPMAGESVNGLWNPFGTGAFRLLGCRVSSVVHPDGRFVDSAADDPVVGCYIADDGARVSAKIVDLDPHDQSASEIFGLRLRLIDPAGREQFGGHFTHTPLDDIWPRYLPAHPDDRADLSAIYQSVLTEVAWTTTLDSPFLRRLRELTYGGELSVKITVDNAEIDVRFPDRLTFGRIAGAIGVSSPEEPRHFVAGRRLRSPDGGRLNHAPCQVDEKTRRVFVDLANSIPTISFAGPLLDLGPLRLALLGIDGSAEPLVSLGTVDDATIERQAGIVSAELSPDQLARVRDGRIAVLDSADEPAVLLAENTDSSLVKADNWTFRIYPEPSHHRVVTTLFVTRFGRPAANADLVIGADNPPPALDYPTRVTTDSAGRAVLTIAGHDPGHPRPHVDGQLFTVPYAFATTPAVAEGRLLIRVFDRHETPARPSWVADIQPVFQRYANLFPVMRNVFDLANYHHVVKYANVIKSSLLLPIESPNHMPVTRDLSPGKRHMIVKWLNTAPRPPVLDIATPEDLRNVLQQAMLVEHAVIPPYLCALFSLKPGMNVEVAETIQQVTREEMLHMALAGNILNAVGGRPVIGRPGLVPTYPNRLPGPVLPDLVVRLRKCSIEHIRDSFLAIEQPEAPMVGGRPFTGAVIDRESVEVDAIGTLRDVPAGEIEALENWMAEAEYRPMTIGWFYNQIARAIIRLDRELAANGKSLFSGDPARQVSWPDAPGRLYRVTDRRTALLAIYEIIEQGEGSPQDLDGDSVIDVDEYGHYYRFMEIVKGRRLTRNRHGKWVYEGDPVRFDPAGVWPMADDPDTTLLPPGTPARAQSELVDSTYTKMLTSLHRIFNGHPHELPDAMALMYSVGVEARKLLALPPRAGVPPVGPAFQSSGVAW